MATLLPCPNCRTSNINGSGARAHCNHCGYVWADWRQYWLDIGTAGIKRPPAPVPPKVSPKPAVIPKDNYITSGEFQKDIEDLVDEAVEKARVEAVLQVLDKLEYDVRMIAGTGGQCHSIIESALHDARKEWDRVNDG